MDGSPAIDEGRHRVRPPGNLRAVSDLPQHSLVVPSHQPLSWFRQGSAPRPRISMGTSSSSARTGDRRCSSTVARSSSPRRCSYSAVSPQRTSATAMAPQIDADDGAQASPRVCRPPRQRADPLHGGSTGGRRRRLARPPKPQPEALTAQGPGRPREPHRCCADPIGPGRRWPWLRTSGGRPPPSGVGRAPRGITSWVNRARAASPERRLDPSTPQNVAGMRIEPLRHPQAKLPSPAATAAPAPVGHLRLASVVRQRSLPRRGPVRQAGRRTD
jgi:hypothetical protein